MNSDDGDHDAHENPKNEGEEHSNHSIGKRIGEFLILALYLVIDAFEIWPHSHLFAVASIPVGLLALLLLDGGFSQKRMAIITGVVSVLCAALYIITPAHEPPLFNVATSASIWARTFDNKDKGPPISTYAVSFGLFRASPPPSLAPPVAVGVDFLVRMAVTNASGTPRRLTEYDLDVAQSKSGPWTRMCRIDFRFAQLFTGDDPKTFLRVPDSALLDNQLSLHAIGPGDTVNGWAAWGCPKGAPNECQPAFLRFILYDSLGQKTEVLTDQLSGKTREPLRDLAASGALPVEITDRSLTGYPLSEGQCFQWPR
jgi:hypothetical protein